VHQIRFRLGLGPGHAGEAYIAPDPLAGLRGLLLREERERNGKGGEGRKGRK